MLEQFFKNPAAAQRWRAGLLGPYLDSFVESVSGVGYAKSSVQRRLYVLRELGRWIESRDLGVPDLKERVVDQFLQQRKRRRKLNSGDRFGVLQFLDHLRKEGVIRASEPTSDRSPFAILQSRYDDYLRKERGVSPETARRYWALSRHFLVERFGGAPLRIRSLTLNDISDFLLRHTRSGTPGLAKGMVTALRSFFRFLFEHGETENDLAKAVLTIPAWSLAEIPKYIKPEEVQRVIEAYDRNTPIGRRNRAVLLLLARLGLRAGEAATLELDDIDWRAGVLTVRGKGGFHDRLPLPQDVGEALATYLRQERPECSTRRVFLRLRAPYRGFDGPSAVCSIVRDAVNRAGLEPPTKGAHLLRHSLATGMLCQGATMAEIGTILRHRAAKTTEIYAKVDIEGLRSLAKLWPIREEVIDE